MIRLLLLGNKGQLGWELERCLSLWSDVIALDFPEVDFSHLDHLRQVVLDSHPQVIINAVAYTAVDRAETEANLAMTVNGKAPGVLAEAARALGAAFIHYSTDYVFDGKKNAPYTEEDNPNPLSAYGLSKLAGDQAVVQTGGAYLIFRSSWIYTLRRENFLTNILKWARTRTEMRIVTDQIGCPTWARQLAEVTAMLLAKSEGQVYDWVEQYHGLYNLASSGYTSRFNWAKEILRLDPCSNEQVVQKLTTAVTADFPTPAQRPLFSTLDSHRFAETFNLRLPDWRLSLRQAMEAS
jgi:dTDP-4-dehydrorhamnose reductase